MLLVHVGLYIDLLIFSTMLKKYNIYFNWNGLCK